MCVQLLLTGCTYAGAARCMPGDECTLPLQVICGRTRAIERTDLPPHVALLTQLHEACRAKETVDLSMTSESEAEEEEEEEEDDCDEPELDETHEQDDGAGAAGGDEADDDGQEEE